MITINLSRRARFIRLLRIGRRLREHIQRQMAPTLHLRPWKWPMLK